MNKTLFILAGTTILTTTSFVGANTGCGSGNQVLTKSRFSSDASFRSNYNRTIIY